MSYLISLGALLGVLLLAFIICWLYDEHPNILIGILSVVLVVTLVKFTHILLFELR